MAVLTSDNTPLPVQREALYPSGTTGAIASGNSATSFSITLGSLQLSGSAALFDAQTATVVIANNGTAKVINAATLIFSDTVGTQTPSISYNLIGVNVANNAAQAFTVSLSNGILKNMSLLIAFASAPTAGNVNVQTTLQCGGSSSGGGSSDITLHDISTPSNHLKVNNDGSINVSGGGVASSVAINDGTATSQKLAVDSSGRITLVPNSSVNVAQWGGSQVSITNPVITADQIRQMIVNGNGYMITTGKQSAGSSGNFPINMWIATGTNRNFLIYSARVAVSASGIHVFTQVTTNPAFTSYTPVNANVGSSNVSLAVASYSTSSQSVNGTQLDAPVGTQVEVFANGAAIFVPANQAAGIGFTLYVGAANTNNYSGSIRWIEF